MKQIIKNFLKHPIKMPLIFLKEFFTPNYVDMGMVETRDEQLKALAQAIVHNPV